MLVKVQLWVSALLLVSLLAACAPNVAMAPTPQASAPAAQPRPAATPAAQAKAAWQVEFDNTVEAARKEGTVTVLTQVGPALRRAVDGAFKSRFDIGIDWLSGTSSTLGVKIMNERRAGIYSADAGIIGHVTPYTVLKPAGALEPLDKLFFLPELTEPQEIQKVWRFGQLEWVDKEHTILAPTPYQPIPMAVNTQLVKPGEIKGYRDLLNPKWKGKMVIYDPSIGSGFGTTWAQMTGERTMGWDYLRQLVEQQPHIVRDNRQGVEWLAHGKYPIGIALANDVIKEFMDIGSPIQPLFPEEGAYTAGGPSAICILKPAPHPNAARLFVNWLLSKEGQTVYSKASGLPSGRLDVPVEGIDPLMIPDPKMHYDASYSEEVIVGVADAVKKIRDIFGKLQK